eukprot:12417799-Karenia_brevis.AAC.1
MSHADLSRRFAKLKPKGLGESCLGGELYAVCPDVFAHIYHPISTKIILSSTSPIQWAGGQLMELFKGKGSSAVPQSFRDVLLSDSDSKAFFGELRGRARDGLFGATP